MHWDVKLALSAAWVFAGTCGYLIVPDAAPFLLPFAALAPMLWYPRKSLARRLWGRSLLARLLAVASAYLLINAIWSTAPQLALIGVATFFVGSVVVHVVNRTMPFLDHPPVRAMAIGFHAAYVVAALLISIEVIFGHPLHLHFYSMFPTLASRPSGAVVEAGVITSLPSYFLNKHIAALVFLIWPALLVAQRLASSPRSRAVALVCLAPVIPAILASDHETSKIAIAGSAAVFAFQMLAPRLVSPMLVAAWIFACAAVVPLTSMAYHLQLHKAEWLQSSAQHRIVIWGVTSAKIAQAPILGHGLVAARALGLQGKEHPTYEPGSPFIVSTGPHAHNVYLQVWFDTGVVGVALLLVIGLFALRAISRAAADSRPALYATFASGALLAASSFSIWARWYLASFALCAAFAVLAARFAATASSCAGSSAAQPLKQDTAQYPALTKKQPILNQEPFDAGPEAALRRSR